MKNERKTGNDDAKKIFCTLSQKSIKSFSPTTQIKWAIYWVSSSVCAVSYSRISGKIDVIMRTKYARNANQLMSERKNIKIACLAHDLYWLGALCTTTWTQIMSIFWPKFRIKTSLKSIEQLFWQCIYIRWYNMAM